MNGLLKIGFAYLLAPSLVTGVAVLLAMAIGLTFTIAVIGVAIMASVVIISTLSRPLIASIIRYSKNRFSPVRRRYPKPTAWHQWR